MNEQTAAAQWIQKDTAEEIHTHTHHDETAQNWRQRKILKATTEKCITHWGIRIQVTVVVFCFFFFFKQKLWHPEGSEKKKTKPKHFLCAQRTDSLDFYMGQTNKTQTFRNEGKNILKRTCCLWMCMIRSYAATSLDAKEMTPRGNGTRDEGSAQEKEKHPGKHSGQSSPSRHV